MKWAGSAIAAALLSAAGCTGNSPSPARTTVQEPMLRRPASELPKVGEYLFPLDDNLLEAAPPAGWTELLPNRAYVAGFTFGDQPSGDQDDLPRITIGAEPAPSGLTADLTEENVPAAAARLDRELRQAVAQKKKRVEEFCLPLIVGETPYVRHVRQALQGSTPCVVQSLQTIRNGRLYTVELIVETDDPPADYKPALLKYRDQGYAVAAHLHFAPPGKKFDPAARFKAPVRKADKPPPTKPGPPGSDAKSKPPAAKPAGTKPAQPKPTKPGSPQPAAPQPPPDRSQPSKTPEKKTP